MDVEALDPSRVIDAIGGTGEVASLCGLTPSAVSQWRKDGIPRSWVKFLRLARPDAFAGASGDTADLPEKAA